MKAKLLAVALAAVSAGAFASPALATGAVTIASDNRSGSFSDSFSAGAFTDTFTFTLPQGSYSVSAFFSSASVPASDLVQFTSATLNGQSFAIAPLYQNIGNGLTLGVSLGLASALSSGVNTLSFSGLSPHGGSLSGSLAIAAVPEPAQWGFMVAGFGAMALMLRGQRRRRVAVSAA